MTAIASALNSPAMSANELAPVGGASGKPEQSVGRDSDRMIDHWFPCATVDKACGIPAGSGKNEKAIFPWFGSRPVAQARAAVLTALLPPLDELKPIIERAILTGEHQALARLREEVFAYFEGRRPVVLDLFSGRGLIPLEAGRAGATSVGVDLSPVATLAGRLIADWPMRDWSHEAPLPFAAEARQSKLGVDGRARLAYDARHLHTEIGRRLSQEVESLYPRNPAGDHPWGYLWAITIPCDSCQRRFPLIGNLALRHPYRRISDAGQSLHLIGDGETWRADIIVGPPQQQPTYSSAGRKGKSGRCLFCGHVHSLESVKNKGFAGDYQDALLAVADIVHTATKVWRLPRQEELDVLAAVDLVELAPIGVLSAFPDENIPPGNVHTVQASGYGYRKFGELMAPRQTFQFATLARIIHDIHVELRESGLSSDYAGALVSLASATFVRRLKYATRGATLQANGNRQGTQSNWAAVKHVFTNEAGITFQFDFFETGPGYGPATWKGLTETGLKPFETHIAGPAGYPARLRRANAAALPFRDASVDVVVCDPPYYDMIEYADASDYFYVWLRRILGDSQADLFAENIGTSVGPDLQNKDDEIIVRRVYNGGVKRDKAWYEQALLRAFMQARRVLKGEGHMVVVFAHSDKDAWLCLLGALHAAGFVVTSTWPSRTESANTGVASIRVTVTISCRVASKHRSSGLAAEVDLQIVNLVRKRVRQWDADHLALADQLMAAYGPAMEVYGQYEDILRPDGSTPPLEHYLTLARAAVRDATAMKVDELPLETFDAPTRFAVFWMRLYGRTDVSKGEARFLAQADGLNLDAVRGALLAESKAGFRLRTDAPSPISPLSSTFEVVRALASAWDAGGTEAAAEVLAGSGREPLDSHLWAVVKELNAQLPPSDSVAKGLAALTRNAGMIVTVAARVVVEDEAAVAAAEQPTLFS